MLDLLSMTIQYSQKAICISQYLDYKIIRKIKLIAHKFVHEWIEKHQYTLFKNKNLRYGVYTS